MGLETATYISDLVTTNPLGSDSKSTADDHIRLLKTTLKNSVVGFTGAVVVTGTDGGAVNAYAITPASTLPAYTSKMLVVFAPTVTNTGASTLNISGIGAASIKQVDGAALASGDLVSGSIYLAEYNGTEFRLIAPTKNYIDQLAFSTSLPAQASNTDKIITTNGTSASWTALLKASVIRFSDATDSTKQLAFDVSGVTTATTRTVTIPNKNGTMAMTSDVGMTLLAVITPSVAANVDFLTTFSSSYDNYLIVGSGLLPSATDDLVFRFAVSGAADTASNYYYNLQESSSAITTATTNALAGIGVLNTGKGASFVGHVLNANDATNLKYATFKISSQSAATPAYILTGTHTAYKGAAITGIRFYWAAGANFTATGKIRIYGYQNA